MFQSGCSEKFSCEVWSLLPGRENDTDDLISFYFLTAARVTMGKREIQK
jgi:hypothetical protein